MNNGLRILLVERIFLKYSDENHPLSINGIINMLGNYGIKATKNTIMNDVHTLIDVGMDIVACPDGYRLVNRLFDSPELVILADAVAAFKFISASMSETLIEKLKKLHSKYETEHIFRHFHIAHRVKTDNKQALINIDAITTAMRENKQFSFDYYDYDTEKNMICNGIIECSPWEMAISSEEYYAVTYYKKYPSHPTNFRIDRMKNIQILDSNRIEPPEEIVIGNYLKSSFCMFSGKEECVTLRFPMTYKMCNIVYDKFGYDTKIHFDGDEHFTIKVPIKTEQPSSFFSWLALFEGKVQIIEPIHLVWEFWSRMNLVVDSIQSIINEYEMKNHRISSENNSVDTR